MHTQILEFSLGTDSIEEIQEQIDSFHEHYDVTDIEITQWEDRILVFLICED